MERMVFLLIALALAGMVVAVNYYASGRELQLEAEVRELLGHRASLRAQLLKEQGSPDARIKAIQERRQLEREVSSLTKENEKLKEQVVAQSALASQLKEEVERLKVGGVAAVKALAEAAAAEAAVAAAAPPTAPVPDTETLRQEREERIAEVVKTVAYLEILRTNLRVQIARGQAEVTALVRGTVDTRAEVPSGCYVDGEKIYRKKLTCGRPVILRCSTCTTHPCKHEHTHSESCYTSYPIGPAVRAGDFRTQYDKDMAIEAARRKQLPLFEEMRPLEKELAQLQEELGKLRKESIEEARTPEEAAGTVLKHKETGETIKGTLTKEKVNNLTVFKLADGGTKLINPEEWETVEADAQAPDQTAEDLQ